MSIGGGEEQKRRRGRRRRIDDHRVLPKDLDALKVKEPSHPRGVLF